MPACRRRMNALNGLIRINLIESDGRIPAGVYWMKTVA
jgi:hypothetical protein